MAGTLTVITMFVLMYTILVPVFTEDMKHLRYGLLLLLAIGAFAFVLHLLHMM